jgi:hypothetical protein
LDADFLDYVWASAKGWDRLVDQMYNKVPCRAGGCRPIDGTIVGVTANQVTAGIDFSLAVGGAIAKAPCDLRNNEEQRVHTIDASA